MTETTHALQIEPHELATVIRSLDWGAVDLYALGKSKPIVRLGELGGYLAMAMTMRDIARVTIVLPPENFGSEGAGTKKLKDGVRAAIKRFGEDDVEEWKVDDLLGRIDIVQMESFDGKRLLETLTGSGKSQATIVGMASFYDLGAEPELEQGCSEEDIWVSNLHKLLTEVVAIAQARAAYVILDAGQGLPGRKNNRDLLHSVDGIGILGDADEPAADADAVVAKVERLFALLEGQNIGAAIKAIEEDKDLSPIQRWALYLELYHQAGLTPLVRKTLDEGIMHFENLPPDGCSRVARIAAEVGRDDYAHWLLQQSLPSIQSQSMLENALRTALLIGRKPVVEDVINSLSKLHPQSPALKRQQARFAASEGRYAEAAERLRSANAPADHEKAAVFEVLSLEITPEALRAPKRLIAEIERRLPDADVTPRVEVLRSLERSGQRNAAIDIFLDPDFLWNSSWLSRAVRVVERAFLSGQGREDAVERLLDETLALLSENPNDGLARVELAALLDPTTAGYDGLPLLLAKVIQLSTTEWVIRPSTRTSERPQFGKIERLPSVMRGILEDLKAKGDGFVQLGECVELASLRGENPDAVLDGILRFLGHYAPDRTEDIEQSVLQNFVVAAAAIAPLANEVNEDLTVVRAAAVHSVVGGRPQLARDLAEQALSMGVGSAERRRHGLLIFGDVYARIGRLREALIAIAAALSCDGSLSWNLVWYQNNLLFRILRDAGVPELAVRFLLGAREALEQTELSEVYLHRLDTMELQARDLLRRNGRSDETAQDLLMAAIENARAVADFHDELLPVALIMRQLMTEIESSGDTVVDAAKTTFASVLSALPAPHRLLVLASGEEPSADDVVSVISTIAPAEYVDDKSYDLLLAKAMAGKLARSAVSNGGDAEAFAYAAEVMSDQGIKLDAPLSASSATNALLMRKGLPLATAQDISATLNLQVVLTNLDTAGLIVETVDPDRVDLFPIDNGDFDPGRFAQWNKSFPHGYSLAGDDQFRASLAGLGLPQLPDRAVFIASKLTRMPPNLLQVDGDPAGLTKALATAPSLDWLKSSMDMGRRGDGSAAAWIPVATDLSDTATLSLLRGEVSDVLDAAGVPLHTGPLPPASFGRADLAILGAHGGLSEDQQYFSSVSDDHHEPANIEELADLLRGSRVAVLFICSGGRRDAHPEHGGAVGLSRRLLNQGVSAVIAPAWPLEFFVARPWLTAFIASWRKGDQVIDACFAANKAVQQAYSYNLRRSLAMTLYGDPSVTI